MSVAAACKLRIPDILARSVARDGLTLQELATTIVSDYAATHKDTNNGNVVNADVNKDFLHRLMRFLCRKGVFTLVHEVPEAEPRYALNRVSRWLLVPSTTTTTTTTTMWPSSSNRWRSLGRAGITWWRSWRSWPRSGVRHYARTCRGSCICWCSTACLRAPGAPRCFPRALRACASSRHACYKNSRPARSVKPKPRCCCARYACRSSLYSLTRYLLSRRAPPRASVR